ncbi:TPA: hypothetical protein DDW69_00555 [candidate division CPR2 bacterium]|uniref:Uncharacterized protein n=1 Tax=candidate division CPR2 bacterium GW2011_GWC1_41_48 TaxID=1618344 RepID=A0A0G0W9V3_UNCC2|nr:MAG: hypothetical protein UT47_C0004G0077 [candidate division CPR2 bacterium GW2011_GWC2_39_35]KKR27146.1 MAG: hypothetical protein UT60_C0059G0002 [candidate division CPR2 bacterium GW2011_GWD2_39_7]KKR27701.1 MAG: hypothetical protein UT59_C0047G0002 [candidate division CPR2 bacterium GW2011_GWD1_39_7]KKS08832.1 MAG: hypothetical protein UU65_C0004G0043 [candidate division CPR2 bacterium GW2011_GWC1_41_48]OGB59762.1 MAG: hypothetical protein A2Y27_02730 [candidate division CPR2 bacterium G
MGIKNTLEWGRYNRLAKDLSDHDQEPRIKRSLYRELGTTDSDIEVTPELCELIIESLNPNDHETVIVEAQKAIGRCSKKLCKEYKPWELFPIIDYIHSYRIARPAREYFPANMFFYITKVNWPKEFLAEQIMGQNHVVEGAATIACSLGQAKDIDTKSLSAKNCKSVKKGIEDAFCSSYIFGLPYGLGNPKSIDELMYDHEDNAVRNAAYAYREADYRHNQKIKRKVS